MSQEMTTHGAGSDNIGRDKITYITQYGEKKIPRYLTSPPFTPETVLGREADLETVSNKLWHENHLLLLMNGEGGIGKTTLAATYWLNNATKYQHLAWLYVDSGIQPALFSLAGQIDVTFDISTSEEGRWEILLRQLANLNDRCLLVLDNANDPDDLTKHYKHLRQLRNFHVVLTTRINELADAPVWKVKPLDRQTATSLFTRYYPLPNPADAELLLNVLVAVGYNTLVIELLAKNLRDLNRVQAAYTLQNLLADLQQKGLLRVRAKAVQTTYGSTVLRTAQPDEIVRAMYDLTQLSQPKAWLQAWLLNNLAVLPAESITFERLDELLKFPNGEPMDDSLLELHRKGWVDWNDADKTVKVSPVVQAVVRDKNPQNLLADCAGLIATLTQILTSPNHTQVIPYANLADSVLNALQENVFELAYLRLMLGDFNKETGNFTKAIDLFTWASVGFDEIGHAENYSVCLERLGSINQALGKFEEALSYFEKVAVLFDELYQSNPRSVNLYNGLGISYWKLGDLYLAMNENEQARLYFVRAEKIWSTLCEQVGIPEYCDNLDRVRQDLAQLG